MTEIRHLYPGGNTCYGFYSFYDYMVITSRVKRKVILKGGPGTGKSTFMMKLGRAFADRGHKVEYHWCSSDNESLDGVVVGEQEVCILDGTSPHVVDPLYPGAVDEIINLGQYWQSATLQAHHPQILDLTERISLCFTRAYLRLQESKLALEEWKSCCQEVLDETAVRRNILGLCSDFVSASVREEGPLRHLFAGAITPVGPVTRVESIITDKYRIYAVKGSPGSGKERLMKHTLEMIEMEGWAAEIFHNPFDPQEIDIIHLPSSQAVLIDVTGHPIDYLQRLNSPRFKRMLDFDQLLLADKLAPLIPVIEKARHRFQIGINDSVAWIQSAHSLHDELEEAYMGAMDFSALDEAGAKLFSDLLGYVSANQS